jgi:lysyl-tRNA synthetase class 2
MTATGLRERLRERELVLRRLRTFFTERDVLEVSTPALAAAGVTDPALHNIGADIAALGHRMYLHTSPEFAMKRLLAAGSGDIWQLARVFRDGELGRWHQPEFQLLEWYRLGFDEHALMDELADLLDTLIEPAEHAFARLTLSYADAFAAAFDVDPHRLDPAARERLVGQLQQRGIDIPAGLDNDGLLDLALSAVIVPAWPRDTLVFVHAYPATQAALARLTGSQPPTAARFELFVNGLELANGFHELTDASEQRRRFVTDLERRQALGLEPVPIDEDLLAALAAGLPDCAGVALGFERLLALLADTDELAAVIDLPHRR